MSSNSHCVCHWPAASRLRALTRVYIIAFLSVLALCGSDATAQTTTASQSSKPDPIILNSGSFQIPFDVTNAGSQPREVRLYMARVNPQPSVEDTLAVRFPGQAQAVADRPVPTTNDAPQWLLLDRQPPGVGQFLLSNTPDGTFLFTTRTIDQQGNPHPNGPMQPDLRVTIDTLPPVIEIDTDADADGSMTAAISWQDATSIKLLTTHYITDATQQWQVVELDARTEGAGFEIAPQDDWQQLSVRVRAVDSAGNEAVENHLVRRPRIAALPSARLASGPKQLNRPDALPNAGVFAGQVNRYAVPAGRPFPGTASQRGYTPAPWAMAQAQQELTFEVAAETVPAPPGSFDLNLPPPATAEEISEAFASGSEPIPAPQPEANTIQGLADERRGQTTASESLPVTPQEAMRPILNESQRSFAGEGSRVENLPAPSGQYAPMATQSETARQTPMPETSFVPETIPTPNPRPEPPSELVAPELNDADLPRANASATDNKDGAVNGNRDTTTKDGWLPKSRLPPRTEETRRATGNALARQTVKRPSLEELSQIAPVQHSSSNRFSLEYELEAVGTQGLEAVELYGTEDGGATWKRWGADPDQASPFDIETLTSGVFGFHIVVVGANGLASPRPLAGDLPQMVVVVDQEQPEVTVTGAKYGEGEFTGSLIIQWRARDEHLLERPITLAFGESTEGPWTTIAGGVRNSGQYAWPADAALPAQIYLRIDAADQAGNVGTYVLDTPVDTRGLAPRARIRGFRPIASTGAATTR
ncbi:MAG: hypothetical protein AAGD07_07515 [Planctomycetota bacterium]